VTKHAALLAAMPTHRSAIKNFSRYFNVAAVASQKIELKQT